MFMIDWLLMSVQIFDKRDPSNSRSMMKTDVWQVQEQQADEQQGYYQQEYRFSTETPQQVLGSTVIHEHLYLIKQKCISVYEYHCNPHSGAVPQLTEELIHPYIDYHCHINQNHICIVAGHVLEVRNRKHWNHVIFSMNLKLDQVVVRRLVVEGKRIYIEESRNGKYGFARVEIGGPAEEEWIELGETAYQGKGQIIFLEEVGLIKEFYIWAKDSHQIIMGMLYQCSLVKRGHFQINSIYLPNFKIHKIFHHHIVCEKYLNQSPQFVLVVASEESKQQQLHLLIYQILPNQSRKSEGQKSEGWNLEEQKSSEGVQPYLQIMSQLKFLQKFELPTEKKPTSLVNQILEEAMGDKMSKKEEQSSHIEVVLENMSVYDNCIEEKEKGVLWISSKNKIAKVQLVREASIDNILQAKKSENHIVHRIFYFDKQDYKSFVGVYHNQPVFSEESLSFSVLINKKIEENEQIQENIAEQLQNQGQKLPQQFEAQFSKKDQFQKVLQEEPQKEKTTQKQQYYNPLQAISPIKQPPPPKFCSECSSKKQSEQQQKSAVYNIEINQEDEPFYFRKKATESIETQTDLRMGQIKTNIIQMREIEDLLMKYSTNLTRSCNKIKENQYQKDRIQKEIKQIVSQVNKNTLEPLMNTYLSTVIDDKLKIVNTEITKIFVSQLELLNENFRKTSIKDQNLRGKKIFDFYTQMENTKNTIESIVDSCKARQIQKISLSEVIFQEIRIHGVKIEKMQKQISEWKNQTEIVDNQLKDEVQEIMTLLEELDSSKSQENSDSEGEDDSDMEDWSEDHQIPPQEFSKLLNSSIFNTSQPMNAIHSLHQQQKNYSHIADKRGFAVGQQLNYPYPAPTPPHYYYQPPPFNSPYQPPYQQTPFQQPPYQQPPYQPPYQSYPTKVERVVSYEPMKSEKKAKKKRS